MITFFNSFVSLFPLTIQPFVRILMAAFIAFTIVDIVLTIIWVVNQIKELFHII